MRKGAAIRKSPIHTAPLLRPAINSGGLASKVFKVPDLPRPSQDQTGDRIMSDDRRLFKFDRVLRPRLWEGGVNQALEAIPSLGHLHERQDLEDVVAKVGLAYIFR